MDLDVTNPTPQQETFVKKNEEITNKSGNEKNISDIPINIRVYSPNTKFNFN